MIMLIKKWTEKMIRLLLERAINIIVDRIILWPFYYPIILSMKKVKISNFTRASKKIFSFLDLIFYFWVSFS